MDSDYLDQGHSLFYPGDMSRFKTHPVDMGADSKKRKRGQDWQELLKIN